MLSKNLKFKVSKVLPHISTKLNHIRYSSNTETLEPVKLSYATYESTNSDKNNQANPLVILHGLFGSKSNWNSLCKVYNQKTNPPRKIMAIDARNHGDSPHSENHTYAHLAADIKALFAQLNIHKGTLMGHSMGGRAVMLFALKYPELVDRLIVVDVSPVTTSPNLDSMPSLFHALETVKLPSSEETMSKARAIVEEQLTEYVASKSLRSFLLTNLVQKSDGSYSWRINIPGLLRNFNNITKFPLVNDLQFKGPVLFIAGGDSDYVQTKTYHQTNLMLYEKNLDLAYASYEPTKSYSDKNPEPTPFLILHGFLASKNNWNSFCKKCHEQMKAKVVAIDARNHGDSPHSREHTYDNLVMDVRQFMYKMGMNKVNLLGHSMGGRTAMLFALKYPELVEKLIIADISPITTSPSIQQLPKLLKILKRVEIPERSTLNEAKKIFSENLYALVGNRRLVSFFLTNLIQKNDGSYSWRFNARALAENFDYISSFPELYNVSYVGPVLFIGGAKSDYIQKSDYPQILKLFPNAELKYIEGAGHWLHSEKPAEFLKITLDFLNKK